MFQLKHGLSGSGFFCADYCPCAAIRKKSSAQYGIEVVFKLDMQRAKLDTDNQNRRVGLCPANRICQSQRREHRVTAHKADIVSLNVFIQVQSFDDCVIRAWIEKARTGYRNKVSYIAKISVGAVLYCASSNINKQLFGLCREQVVAHLRCWIRDFA